MSASTFFHCEALVIIRDLDTGDKRQMRILKLVQQARSTIRTGQHTSVWKRRTSTGCDGTCLPQLREPAGTEVGTYVSQMPSEENVAASPRR